MTKYSVTCYATKVGSAHMNNAHKVVVDVEADDVADARSKAIDAVYASHKDLEHINPRGVIEVP